MPQICKKSLFKYFLTICLVAEEQRININMNIKGTIYKRFKIQRKQKRCNLCSNKLRGKAFIFHSNTKNLLSGHTVIKHLRLQITLKKIIVWKRGSSDRRFFAWTQSSALYHIEICHIYKLNNFSTHQLKYYPHKVYWNQMGL